jgi:hypothetical protein
MPEFAIKRSAIWLAAGLLVGLAIQTSQARYAGNWSGLLSAGSDSPFLPVLAHELPDLVVFPGEGHDGQATYGVGLDPLLRERPPAVPDASYRYRRILLPLLGSGFGTLDGRPLLIALTSLNLLGFGLACWAAALIAEGRALNGWLAVAALANVGIWLSLQTTTPDAFAFGLMLFGVAVGIRGRTAGSAVLVAAATLSKETYALVGVGLLAWALARRERKAAAGYAMALLPAGAWSVYLAITLREGLATGGNLGVPFDGIFDAAPLWPGTGIRDQALTALTLAGLGLSVYVTFKRPSFWSFLIVPWILLAVVSSHWIWDLGNNSIRSLAPVFSFALFSLFEQLKSGQPSISLRNLPV